MRGSTHALMLLLVLPLLARCAPPWVLSEQAPPVPPSVTPLAPVHEPLLPSPAPLASPPPALVETPSEVTYVALPAIVTVPRLSPTQRITEGQQTSRVGPGHPLHHQEGAMHHYRYAVGATYEIYLTPTQATGLLFPTGERLKVGLFLPKDDFDIETKTAGEAEHSYDAITLHPRGATGDYEAFVLMTNGKAYLFHFLIGKKGMLTVSMDTASPRQVQAEVQP